jgi:AraC-like DNA-binding protein
MMHSVVAELQPIIDAIDASLRDGWRFADRDVSIALPAGEGRSLIVSVRPAGTRAKAHAAPGRGLDERQLRLVESAIHERIAEPISVSALSSVAGLSRSHFSNAFRTSVGRTPHAYVVRLRLERAMKLMGETDTALSEIALATGFADQAHFSNAFRRAVGMTPTQWRAIRHPFRINVPEHPGCSSIFASALRRRAGRTARPSPIVRKACNSRSFRSSFAIGEPATIGARCEAKLNALPQFVTEIDGSTFSSRTSARVIRTPCR